MELQAAGPHLDAAECSEASHCEKNEQIIGFSISSKCVRTRRALQCPGKSCREHPTAATGMLQAAEHPCMPTGTGGHDACEGTRLVGTIAPKGRQKDAKPW